MFPKKTIMVERGGFEPPKASPADLQSAPFGHSGTSPLKDLSITDKYAAPNTLDLSLVLTWSQRRESNPRPTDYKSVALPSELRWPTGYKGITNKINFL